jgi:transcriptional regulator with XRE-family HTH domain
VRNVRWFRTEKQVLARKDAWRGGSLDLEDCFYRSKLASMQKASRWYLFVERELDDRGWTGAEFARRTSVSASRLNAWKDGGTPTPDLVRMVAEAFNVPILEAYVHAEFLTPEEATGVAQIAPTPDMSALSDRALIRELERRLAGAARGKPEPPTAEEIAANPERYEVIGLDQIRTP